MGSMTLNRSRRIEIPYYYTVLCVHDGIDAFFGPIRSAGETFYPARGEIEGSKDNTASIHKIAGFFRVLTRSRY